MADVNGKKLLVAFDFDHTLIDDNADLYIKKLAPNNVFPAEFKALYTKEGWTLYMGKIFKFLHSCGVSKNEMLNCIGEITLSPGMKKLLLDLPCESTEMIIISDANQVFIDHILETNDLKHVFKEIYTNPAKFNDDGCLEIEMFHSQTYCDLSTINLCKGKILHDYVESKAKLGVTFNQIAYVGDGMNDYCPSLCLQTCDLVFPRVGFSLVEYIKKMETERGLVLKPFVYPWKSGEEILNAILSSCKNDNENPVSLDPRVLDPATNSIFKKL